MFFSAVYFAFLPQFLYAQSSQDVNKGTEKVKTKVTQNPETKIIISGTDNAAALNLQKGVPLVSTWDFIKMVLVLGGVVAVIYLLFFLLKKGAKKRFADNEFIEIIGSKGLSGGKALHLVKVGESIFLIGSADNSINLVSQITEKESLDSLKLDMSQKTQRVRKSFQNTLSDIFRKRTDANPLIDSARFLKKQRERLHKLK